MPSRPKFVLVDKRETKKYDDLDITELIMELHITHEDIDAEGAGRDIETGKMVRTTLCNKHTYEVKLVPVTETELEPIIDRIRAHGTQETPEGEETIMFYGIRMLHPCAPGRYYDINDYVMTVYTSSIDFGAQQYDKSMDETIYRGVTFKAIER